jgi:uncharacterized membrane protein
MAKLLPILFLSLVLEAVGVVFLDKGLHEIGEVQRISLAEILRIIGRGATNRYILSGLLFETLFFIGLLIMLSNWDVSLIWPLTSLGFVLTTLAAIFIRHETVTSLRWTGVILIMIGAALVGWSEKRKDAHPGKPLVAADSRLGKQ